MSASFNSGTTNTVTKAHVARIITSLIASKELEPDGEFAWSHVLREEICEQLNVENVGEISVPISESVSWR